MMPERDKKDKTKGENKMKSFGFIMVDKNTGKQYRQEYLTYGDRQRGADSYKRIGYVIIRYFEGRM